MNIVELIAKELFDNEAIKKSYVQTYDWNNQSSIIQRKFLKKAERIIQKYSQYGIR